MSRYTNGQDNEFWLEAWNGKSFNVERQTRSLSIDYLLVGLLGGFQPDKLEPSFGERHDGMYARLCFSWPSEAEYRPLNDSADEVEDLLYNILTRIIDLPAEDEDGVFSPRKIELSASAVQEFEKYRRFMHETRKGLEGREREWFSKTATHVLRLAGTLTFIRWAAVGGPEPTEVDVTSLKAAVRLVRDYFWPHSRAAVQRIGGNERGANARLVVRWVFTNRKTEISVLDVRTKVGLGGRTKAKEAEEVLDDLVVCGFLQKVTGPTGKKGGRPSVRWLVNPKATPPSETSETSETHQRIEILDKEVRRLQHGNLPKPQKPTRRTAFLPSARPATALTTSADHHHRRPRHAPQTTHYPCRRPQQPRQDQAQGTRPADRGAP